MVFTRRQSRMVEKHAFNSADFPQAPTSPPSDRNDTPPLKMPGSFITATTPKAGRGPLSFLNSITQRAPKTPKDRTPIKPVGFEMHPQLHHKSTANTNDEARWLGFFNMGSQTAPEKPSNRPAATAMGSPIPTPFKTMLPKRIEKSVPTENTQLAKPQVSPPLQATQFKRLENSPPPAFEFTFKRQPSLELSAEAQQLMAESREEAAKIRAQMAAALPSVPEDDPSGNIGGRKFAKAKGKAGRYSEVHMEEFKKMDSIANHPSAWRVDTNRSKPVVTNSLKRYPSKADMEEPAPMTLKRSPSKAELDAPTSTALKRSPSKAQLDTPEKTPFVTRSPSKLVMARDETYTASLAKRVKHAENDDAATTRPVSRDDGSKIGTLWPRNPMPKGSGKYYSSRAQPLSRAMTPTKASLARAQSAKNLQTASMARSQSVQNLRSVQTMIPSLVRSKSTRNLAEPRTPHRELAGSVAPVATPTPAKVADFGHATPVKALETLTSPPSEKVHSGKNSLSTIRSILRTPHRLYSDDPTKIAAGTHFATPPKVNKSGLMVPATAPVKKHVDFSSSTKEKDELAAARAMSVDPQPVTYPALRGLDSADRRQTLSGAEMSGPFTFHSGGPVAFAAGTKSTIRPVRSSDVGLAAFSLAGTKLDSPSKRKVDTIGAASDEKENDEGEVRGAKKARTEEKPEPRQEVKKSRLPTRNTGGRRPGSMTTSRLRMLSMPKKR